MGVDTILTGVPEFDQLEIIKIITPSLVKAASTEVAFDYISHDLGYIPIIEAHIYNPVVNPLDDQSISMPLPQSFVEFGLAGAFQDGNGKVFFHARALAQLNNIYIEIRTPNLTTGNAYYTSALTYKFLIIIKRLKSSG
jgi:hypothetical protein